MTAIESCYNYYNDTLFFKLNSKGYVTEIVSKGRPTGY